MARAVPIWKGKTDDSKVPDRVRQRIFDAHDGKCWLSGRDILPSDKWDLDHKIALIAGGSHDEANLAPALRDKHKAKTAEDVREKSKVAKVRKKHLGLRKPSRFPGGRNDKFKKKMDGTVVKR